MSRSTVRPTRANAANTTRIERNSTERSGAAPPEGRFARRAALSGAGGLALAGMIAGAERLPGWGWTWGGFHAEVGTRPISGAAAPAQPAPASQPPTPLATSRHVFATHAEAAAFAAKSGVHLLAPEWVPPGFAPEPVAVTLGQLPPEAAAALGRGQRVATTQRFTAADGDGQFTLVQSVPPPLFDFLSQYQRQEGDPVLVNGVPVQYGEFPQGVVLYWRERGDRRSLGVIGDPAASTRLARADWLRFAESLR